MVCDFFHPRLGGVEMHLWSLSQSLLALGHDVIIITHSYKKGNNYGVRYLVGGCKVYYMPIGVMVDDDILPTFCGCTFSLVRWICIREQIDLLHVHQATSVLANEALVYANEININNNTNIPTVYTDHSLFGINTDIASILLNRILSITTSTCSAILCVSHACRDNFLLRTHMDPSLVHVIPNAISATKYQPDPSKRPHHSDRYVQITILKKKKEDIGLLLYDNIYQYLSIFISLTKTEKMNLNCILLRGEWHNYVDDVIFFKNWG